MTNYRVVARHVRYWRGEVHKWSTVWPFTGDIASASWGTAIAAIKTLEQGVNYSKSSGAVQGGVWEIALYNQSSGGVPVAVANYFDPDTPLTWVAYSGVGWTVRTSELEKAAETALLVEWNAGLSATGKPVKFRKWFHQVPQPTTLPPGADVSGADITSLQNLINAQIAVVGGLGAPMGNGSRLAATQSIVQPFYGNHQMPRGRRRRALVTASGQYTGPSIVVPQRLPTLAN